MIAGLCSASHPVWMWVLFILFVILLLVVDLGIFHRKTHAVSIKEALTWAGVWFGLAMIFNAWVWWECGAQMGLQFFTGYIIEKSLSVDNLFVILLVFMSFQIPAKYQHRVLFWGILGALVMRGLLIGIGAALVARFEWIFYIFGIFLLYTGIKMFFEGDEEYDPRESWMLKLMHKLVPITKLKGERFFTKERGRIAVTILFVTLAVVEFTDVVFAFDSIPAIFAISSDPFIVFTSNVFAILGLRSLYFVVAKAHDLFKHLKAGLAVILSFIGVKLLIRHWYEIPIFISLAVVILILLFSILISIYEKELLALAGVKQKRRKAKRASKSS